MVKDNQIKGYFLEAVIGYIIERYGYLIKKEHFISGRGSNHQIDCYGHYKFQIPFVYPINLIVEAKAYKNKIQLGHMRSFVGLMKDITERYFPNNPEINHTKNDFNPNTHVRYTDCGLFVSLSGFEESASNIAFAHGIYLIDLSNKNDFSAYIYNLLNNPHIIVDIRNLYNVNRGRKSYRQICDEYIRNGSNIMYELEPFFVSIALLDGSYPVFAISRIKVLPKPDTPDLLRSNFIINRENNRLEIDIPEELIPVQSTEPKKLIINLPDAYTSYYFIQARQKQKEGENLTIKIDLPIVIQNAQGKNIRRIITIESEKELFSDLANYVFESFLEKSKEVRERVVKEILEEFHKNDQVSEITTVKDFDIKIHKESEFIQLTKHPGIDREWFTDPSFHLSLEWEGENIATGELNFLIKEIIGNAKIEKVNIPEFELDVIEDIISKLPFKPEDILIPVEYYTHKDFWKEKHSRFSETRGKHINLAGNELRVHWSNNYVPFDDIIISSPSAFEWVRKKVKEMKPSVSGHKSFTDADEPLDISMRLYGRQIGVLVRSVIKCEIKDPTKVLIINIKGRS